MISELDAANALNYLLAARALTVVDGQARVWADYLNHEIDDPRPAELLPACRRAIRQWARENRSWQVDVERYAANIRAARRERMDHAIDTHGRPDPAGLGGEPKVENAWRTAWMRAVWHGEPDPEQAAWDAIGRQPPPPLIEAGGPTGPEAARAAIRALAKTHTTS
ncbi:hypothetical protein [Actinomyces faecalis]|uniref:hypothetical protein n=1 Tax=Actinomyces faecalis TaxID=2722820 RepID=UPI001551CFFB|nr:hypothetical protein [Actinomyces faecalis]